MLDDGTYLRWLGLRKVLKNNIKISKNNNNNKRNSSYLLWQANWQTKIRITEINNRYETQVETSVSELANLFDP